MPSQNYNTGKHRPSLVLKDMANSFHELIKVREAGIAKGYDRMNWAESIGTDDAQRFLDENADSMFRHLMAYMSGEEYDKESGCHHLAHVACRAFFGVEYTEAVPNLAEMLGAEGHIDRIPSQANPCPHDTISYDGTKCGDCGYEWGIKK